MAELNMAYLNHTGPTNVISFPMQEGQFSDITPELLGDVVISADTADREASEAGMEMSERFNQLLSARTLRQRNHPVLGIFRRAIFQLLPSGLNKQQMSQIEHHLTSELAGIST